MSFSQGEGKGKHFLLSQMNSVSKTQKHTGKRNYMTHTAIITQKTVIQNHGKAVWTVRKQKINLQQRQFTAYQAWNVPVKSFC